MWVLTRSRTCVLARFFFFKQKTAYEMRISDWSSDVCSSDLQALLDAPHAAEKHCAQRRIAFGPLEVEMDQTVLLDQRDPRRSEERSEGKECVSTCRSRRSPSHYKNKHKPNKKNQVSQK